jgi:hypothetical protein
LLTSFSCCKFFMDIFSSGFYHMFCIQVCLQWCALKEFFSGSRRPFLCLMGRCFACTGTKLSWNPTSWLQLEWRFSLLFDLTLSLLFWPVFFLWQNYFVIFLIEYWETFGNFCCGNTTSTVLGICKISSQNWEKECETIFNIYSSIFFQWYIESLFWTAFFLSTLLLEIFGITQHSNPMLKVWKCILSHLWQCESNDSPNSHQTILIT